MCCHLKGPVVDRMVGQAGQAGWRGIGLLSVSWEGRNSQSATTMREDLRRESNWAFEAIETTFCDMMGILRQLSLTGYDGVAETTYQPGIGTVLYLACLSRPNVEPLQ